MVKIEKGTIHVTSIFFLFTIVLQYMTSITLVPLKTEVKRTNFYFIFYLKENLFTPVEDKNKRVYLVFSQYLNKSLLSI